MITTNFLVKKRKISQLDSVPYTGEYNIDTFHFEFDEEWNGLDKTLVIVTDNKRYNVPLLHDECVIPYEFYTYKGNVLIGLFGTYEGQYQTLATGWLPIYIEDDSYSSVEPENLPTPTQWDLYVTEINRLLGLCEESEENCQAILEQLQNDYNTYIEEFNQIKNDTEEYKNQTEQILQDVEDVKQDIIDMGASRTFATFYLDAQTGDLYVIDASSLGNMGFYVQDGDLYVNINSEVNN